MQFWVKPQTLPDSKGALKCMLCLSVCPTGQQRRLAFVLGAILLGGGGNLNFQALPCLFKDKRGWWLWESHLKVAEKPWL